MTDSEKLLKKCLDISFETIKIASTVLKDISNKHSDFHKEMIKLYPYIPYEQMKKISYKCFNNIEENAEKTYKEKEFATYIAEIEDYDLDELVTDFPFLVSVWSGDVYGESEAEGLTILLSELKKNHEILSDQKKFIDFMRQKYLDD